MGLRKLFKERSNKSGPDEDGTHKKSKRPEESLQEIQGRYRKLLNHTQAIQYTHDLQGQFLSVDQEITEFLGYDRNSLLNMNLRTILSSEVRHKFETYLAEIKRQGVSKGLMVVQTASGEKRILKYYNTLRTEGVAIPFVQGIAYDVTEQKQTRKTLKQLSEQLSIILKSLPIVCYICKAEEDYGATYITHNVKAITGFEQTDFTSKSFFWANRIHPEDAPKIFADFPQIFEKGYHEHQYRWQVADGSYKWFYDYTRLIKSSDGRNYIIGMMQDITERKRAEEALKKEKDKAQTYLDVAGVLLVAINTEEKVTLINKKGCEILGYTQEEVIGKNWFDHFIPERMRKEVKTVFSNLAAGETEPVEYFENRVLTKSGEEKIIAWHNTVITDDSGHIMGTLSSGEDITQNKQAQEALLHAAQQWRTTFDGINDFVSLLDLDGKILRCNMAMKDFVGKPFNEIINHSCWEIILGTTTPIEECPFLRMKETLHRETTILSVNDLWFNVSVDPIFDQASRLIGAVNIISDITKRKQAEEAVTKLSQENAIMAEIGRIISSTLNIDEVYERFSQEVHKLIPFDRIEIITINPQDYTITIAYITGIDVPGRNAGDTIPMSGTAVQEVFRSRSSQLIQPHNIEEVARRFPPLLSSFEAGLRSMIFVPLFSEDQVIGALSLKTTKPGFYTERDLRLTERVGNQIAGAIANAQLFIDRKRAEEDVRRNEEKLQALMDASPMAISWADMNGTVEYNNRKFRELFGYTVEDIPTIAEWRRLAYPDPAYRETVPSLVVMLTEAQKQGRGVTPIELTITCKDGSTRYVEEMGGFASNRILAIYKDITERKLAEEALRQSEEKYRTILENMQDGYFEVDLAGNLTFVNDAECRNLRRPREELIGMNYREYTDEATSKKLYQAFNGVYRTGEPVKVLDVEVIRKDGTKAVDQTSVSLIRDSEGKPIGFRGIARDVTEYKQAEEALQKSEKEAKRLSQENAIMAEIGRVISSTLNIDEVYERFAEEVRKLLPFDRIVINVIDIEKATVTNVYMAGTGIADRKVEEVYPLKGSGNAEMVRTKSSLLIQTEDFNEYKDRFPMLLSTFQAGFRSIINIPLFSKGRIIGGLLLRSLKPYAYTDGDVRLAERVGDQIAGAIANAQLYTERKRAEEAAARLAQENAVMAEIGRIINSTLNIDEVYERFAEEVRKLISFDRIMINIVNPGNNTTSFAYAAGNDVPDRRVGDITPLKGTATFECMRTRSNLLIQPEDIDKCLAQFPALLPTFQAGLRSLIFVPLISKDQFIGVLSLRSLKPQAYTDQDMRLAERVGNQIAGAIANAQLYAEQKQMEEALRESGERFRDLYDHAPLGYHEYDVEGRLTNVNRTDLDMLGYTAEEMIGHPVWKFNVEGDVLREEVLAKLAGTSPPGRNLERIYRRKDGTTIPVLVEDRLILDEKGQIKGIRCAIQDITERKRAEEALRKSEAKFQELFDEAPVGYQEIDSEGRIIRINRTELDMLGYTADEMFGRYVWDFITDEESRQKVSGKLAGTIASGIAFERPFQRKDGTTFPAVMQDRVLRNSEGKITGIRATVQDVTERRRSEDEKALLQEQLRQSQKMEAIGKLAGGVAHDFNNLLTVIHGYSELILSSLDQSSQLRQDVQEIINASERASSLTRQLLAFSRKQVLQPKVLDLNAHVSNMDKMLRRMIGEDVELVTLLTKDLGRIKADPGQIEQAILNLAVNAKDAMLSGGKLTIETANVKLDENYARSRIGVTPGDYVMLSMSDTGVGMAPETKERIFEPFFTTKEKERGTGLGLSTVYGIVQQSGGNIWVYSEPGLGTTFKIYLPTIEGDTESLRPAPIPTRLLQGSETVLLVEDEEMVRKLACTVLEKNGYRVLEASNGNEALDVVQGRNGNPIHLVVTDVVMPGMSGRQLADRLVSLRPEIKILYMSGYTDDAIVHHGVLDPGIAYIQKPFTPDALASKVREILDGN